VQNGPLFSSRPASEPFGRCVQKQGGKLEYLENKRQVQGNLPQFSSIMGRGQLSFSKSCAAKLRAPAVSVRADIQQVLGLMEERRIG
jgi:hypothetical protein